MKNEKMGKMQKAMLLCTVLPTLILGIAIAMQAVYLSRTALEKEVDSSLVANANMLKTILDENYPGLCHDGGQIAGDSSTVQGRDGTDRKVCTDRCGKRKQ